MTEIKTVSNLQTNMNVHAESTSRDKHVPTEKLIEDVAQFIARNPDGSLDIKTAKEFSILDLLDNVIILLDSSIADTPEDKELIEKQYKAFSALLDRRQQEYTPY